MYITHTLEVTSGVKSWSPGYSLHIYYDILCLSLYIHLRSRF